MSYSYFQTLISFPLDKRHLEKALDTRIGDLPALDAGLRSSLDEIVRELRSQEHSLMYFPDQYFVDAHLRYLSGLTCREIGALREDRERLKWVYVDRPGDRSVSHISLQANEVSHLAFAYIDAALAMHLAAQLTAETAGLFLVAPTGEKDRRRFVFVAGAMHELVTNKFPRDTHPTLLSLSDSDWELDSWMPRTVTPTSCALPAGRKDTLRREWQAFLKKQFSPLVSTGAQVWLGSSHYTMSGRVYYDFSTVSGDDVELEGCDIATFREFSDGEGVGNYALDGKHLWYYGRPLPCVDPNNFRLCEWSWFVHTDGVHLYKDDLVLEGVDARSIRLIGDPDMTQSCEQEAMGESVLHAEGFVSGDAFYWALGGWNQAEVDGATFRALGRSYFADSKRVYYKEEFELTVLEGFDPATFRWFDCDDTTYVMDSKRVGVARGSTYQPIILKGAQPASFRAHSDLPFAVDDKRVWRRGKVCKDLTPETLMSASLHEKYSNEIGHVGGRYFVCEGKAYFIGHDGELQTLDADVATFKQLSVPLACDRSRIWHWGELVRGADPKGFEWVHAASGLWTNGKRLYEYDVQMRPDWLQAAQRGTLNKLNRAFTAVDERIYFAGHPVRGLRAQDMRAISDEAIGDGRFLYSPQDLGSGPIMVWSREPHTLPLAIFELDTKPTEWVCKVDPAAMTPEKAEPILTAEEYRTLMESIPNGSEFDEVTTTFNDPPMTLTRLRLYGMRISAASSCDFRSQDDRITADVSGVETGSVHRALREAMEKYLAIAAPLSFDRLNELILRIPADRRGYAYDMGDVNVFIQDAESELQGVWVDRRLSDGTVSRSAVFVDDGFFRSWYGTGPARAFLQGDDADFSVSDWTAEHREKFREAIAQFLSTTPPLREPPKSKRKRESRDQDAIDRDEYTKLLSLLMPNAKSSLRKQVLRSIVEAASVENEDESQSGLSFFTPDGRAWEALLDALEQHSLLGTFDRQNPDLALDTCHAMSSAAGIEALYELSDNATGQAVSIADDFNVWLQQHDHCLLTPFGALRCDDDEKYPMVIVRRGLAAELVELALGEDESRGFFDADGNYPRTTP